MDELIKKNESKNIHTEIIDELIKFLDYAGQIFNQGFFLSRGHNKLDWKLLPSIFRETILHEINQHIKDHYESSLTTEFCDKFNYYQKEPIVLNDEATCLITMQHYGLPTRLLDWANDIQTSLFFAVNFHKRDKSQRKEYAVWFLHPDIYRSLYGTAGSTYYRQISELIANRCKLSFYKILYQYPNDLEYPLFFAPRYLFSRIEAQHSIFSVHGWNKIAFEDMNYADKFLKCVIIIDDDDKFYSYVNNILNLTYKKYFPDVFGFIEDMNREHVPVLVEIHSGYPRLVLG